MDVFPHIFCSGISRATHGVWSPLSGIEACPLGDGCEALFLGPGEGGGELLFVGVRVCCVRGGGGGRSGKGRRRDEICVVHPEGLEELFCEEGAHVLSGDVFGSEGEEAVVVV